MPHDTLALLADDIRGCRVCREPGDARRETFAQAVGSPDRPPEIHDGPETVDILIIAINPRLTTSPIPRTRAEYLSETRKTMGRPREDGLRDRYVAGVEEALPTGYSWWNRRERTVGNTRMCKCPTPDWDPSYNWAAAECSRRFLARELGLLKPKVLLVLGIETWRVALPLLGVSQRLAGEGPHLLPTTALGLPIVAAHHLTRKSKVYRALVRRELEKALGGPTYTSPATSNTVTLPLPSAFAPPKHSRAARASRSHREPVTLNPGDVIRLKITFETKRATRSPNRKLRLAGALSAFVGLVSIADYSLLGSIMLVGGIAMYLAGRLLRTP